MLYEKEFQAMRKQMRSTTDLPVLHPIEEPKSTLYSHAP